MTLKEFVSELLNGSNNASISKSNSRYLRIFDDVIGHEEVKEIMAMALDSKEPIHVLLVGPPGTSKTMFMEQIMRKFSEMSFFTIGAHSTKAGMIDALFEKRPKFLLVDEIEDMPEKDQVILFSLMQNGRVSETKRSSTRDTTLKTHVFATSNDIAKIRRPLLDRFIVIDIKKYDRAEFETIALEMLTREHIRLDVAKEIIEAVHTSRPNPSIRECLSVGRLVKNNRDKIALVLRNVK